MDIDGFREGYVASLQLRFSTQQTAWLFFHWSQAIWRKVQEIGICPAYNKDLAVKRVIRCLLYAWPAAPHSLIPQTFRLLNNATLNGKLQQLFRCLWKTWMRLRVGSYVNMWLPYHCSVFGRHMRTNNSVEGWLKRV